MSRILFVCMNNEFARLVKETMEGINVEPDILVEKDMGGGACCQGIRGESVDVIM